MKKISTFLFAFLFAFVSFASSDLIAPSTKPAKPKLNAADVMLPLGTSGDQISLLDLSRMSVKDVERYTGTKMKLADKVGFKIAQKQLRNSINPDGTINDKKLEKAAAKRAADGSGFHLGGFALGFLLGLIGILIAYLIKDDLKSQRVKWAWLGLAAWLVILIILLVI
jgi:hypothetical protein